MSVQTTVKPSTLDLKVIVVELKIEQKIVKEKANIVLVSRSD